MVLPWVLTGGVDYEDEFWSQSFVRPLMTDLNAHVLPGTLGLLKVTALGKHGFSNGSAITHCTLLTTKTELSGKGLAHLSQGIGTSIKNRIWKRSGIRFY